MTEREPPAYLPPLPNPWAIADYVPDQAIVLLPTAPSPVEQPIPQEGAAPAPDTTPERQRVVLTGRIGRAPTLGTTPKGQPKLFFPLATHPDEQTTVWKRVLAFGDKATQLHGSLKAGAQVEVIGYVHQNQSVSKNDGTVRQVEEIYAHVVRKRSDASKPPRRD
jgi:primosomal replication protein N